MITVSTDALVAIPPIILAFAVLVWAFHRDPKHENAWLRLIARAVTSVFESLFNGQPHRMKSLRGQATPMNAPKVARLQDRTRESAE